MRNAPAAPDMPNCCAVSAKPKHKVSPVMSKVSSDLNRSTKWTSLLAKNAPRTNARTAKAVRFTTMTPMPPMSVPPVVATPVSTVSKTTAAKSSTTRIPTINRPQISSSCPDSRSIVISIAELLIHMAEPRKTASISLHPNRLAISNPRANIVAISTAAMNITLPPT